MSPRKALVLREGGTAAQTLHDHLVTTVANLIGRTGSAALTVRDIAREAKVADGVLYNHFADKEDLIAAALHAHMVEVGERALADLPQQAGKGTVEDNLREYITRGLQLLTAILPIFAGLLTQPKVLARFAGLAGHDSRGAPLRRILADYLRAEQETGRIAATVNAEAAATMIIGACHDLVLPHLLDSPPHETVEIPLRFVDDLISTIWQGIAPPAEASDH
jgi:AcrR family transcriptional regulator